MRLLRVLQEKVFEPLGAIEPVRADVRVLAATNKDLEKAMAQKQFRKDLYYRLCDHQIHIPPLRERITPTGPPWQKVAEIGAEAIMDQIARELRLDPNAVRAANYYGPKTGEMTPYGQPVVTRRYSEVLPSFRTPVRGLWFCTMAQVYPEDRGVNYAVSYARRAARQMLGLEPGRRSGPGDLQRPSEAGGGREYA